MPTDAPTDRPTDPPTDRPTDPPTDVPLDIGEITDADVRAVVDLWHACDLTRPWNDPERDVADARLGATSTILVGRLPDLPVAATAMVGYDGHRGWVYYLAVDPRLQGAGYGRAMVVAAEAWLLAAGARKVLLMVRTSNPGARDFYAGLGYTASQTAVLGRWLDGPEPA